LVPVHIELTEMLRCPAAHEDSFLVLSTGELVGRMVRSGILGCPVCHREYPITKGVVQFSDPGRPAPPPLAAAPAPARGPRPDAQTLQALLDLSGPGGYVVLVGAAATHAAGLAELMGGIHFVGVDAPPDIVEQPVLSLVAGAPGIPLRSAMARSVVLGPDARTTAWLAEAQRVLLRGRRLVVEGAAVTPPAGVTQLAAGQGLWVGEKR
jgi:uncharacterized protein YbaR (Trm112 family)